MDEKCQVHVPRVIAIAGVAGSGKSTLGRALASWLRRPLVDLDSVTTPLLEALPAGAFSDSPSPSSGPAHSPSSSPPFSLSSAPLPAAGASRTQEGHWLSGPHASAVRDGRYAALRAVTHDVVSTGGGAVVVAPFTAELAGGDPWQALRAAAAPANVVMVRIVGDPDVFAARRAERGAARDRHRVDAPAPEASVPTIDLDADLTTDQQLTRLLPALGVRVPVDASSPLFHTTFDAVLCDLDGSLVDSTASVARSWRRWAVEYDVSAVALHENHGRTASALISRLLPPELHEEAHARIAELEVADAPGLRPVRGADRFWASLPEARRAIVTSGTVPIASARLAAAGLTRPAVWITAEAVEHGKPDPEPYLRAAERLGVDPARCLVVEDAPAGIASARAAGCAVLAVTGTAHTHELADATLVVDGLDRISVIVDGDGVRFGVLPASGRNGSAARPESGDPA
jgi:sugar-phosphatase